MGKKNIKKSVKPKKQASRPQQQQQFKNFAQIEEFVSQKREQFEFEACIQLLTRFLDYSKNMKEIVRALNMLGEIYVDSGNPVSALSCFEKSIQADPTNATTFMSLGQLYGIDPPSSAITDASQSKSFTCYMKGIELLTNQLAQSPNNEQLKFEISMAYCTIAELYMTDLCDLPDAEQSCRQALQSADLYAPNNPHVLQDWASFLITTHQNAAAQSKLEQVVQIILQLSDQLPQQQQQIQIQEDQLNQIKEILTYDFQLGTCRMLQELDRAELSKPILKFLLLQFDEFPDVWYLLGQVYAKENNAILYKSHLLKAMELAKGDYFEVEIKNELMEKFGDSYKQGALSVEEMEEMESGNDAVVVAEGGEDDDEWSDVDSDEEMN